MITLTRKRVRPLTEVPGLNDTWEYRGVRITTNERRGYLTYSQIVSPAPPHGTGRFHDTTITALQRRIDRHLDAGGKIKPL